MAQKFYVKVRKEIIKADRIKMSVNGLGWKRS